MLDDADLDLAAQLACEGCFRNSGQRCTAVRRLLVHEAVLADFTERFVELARTYTCGDPTDEATRVGTVIDERAAQSLEARRARSGIHAARESCSAARGRARSCRPPSSPTCRAPPISPPTNASARSRPIFSVRDLDDAIALANATPYGLSSGIVTRSMESAIKAVKGIRAGTVNVNEIPGYRLELSPFGGVKDSGLGIKEGVIEAIKFMTTVKTFSLPW